MRDIFFDLSVRSVRLNFLRSLLASIGIVIGVVAISSMGMLGTNMQLSVKDQLSADVNTIMLTSDAVKVSTGLGAAPVSSTIDTSTLNDIKGSAGQNDVVPIHHTSTQFSVGDQNGRGSIYGLDPSDVPKFLTIAQGSNIRGSDVLVGATIASNFNLVVGSTIKIGQNCATISRPVVRVAGILQARGIAADGVNVDNGIVVDDTWYTDHFGGLDQYDQVNVIVADVSTINQTEAAINAKVNRNSDVVRVSDASSRLSTISSTLGTITTFIMAIGGISLVVAAVSIFNVMMMSVKERVQEIGILLSIGTEKGEVRRMFLYEALILGLIGAVVGGIMSFVIGYSVVNAMIGTTQYFFRPESLIFIPYGMIIGVVVCVVSGLYPAWAASNMDPIDALRAE
ncbi:ABC transporter permease [Methanoregula sp.]|uniref:ABC transporter permease n=1 Tax=Methanoregula sp. TaxID=2052170 RepID=UPI002B661C38|nr:FtsX-like permease family protein [Methanoregula sp.]HVP97362.1 FtsX-like permease family protein [Methanoregula sp.]